MESETAPRGIDEYEMSTALQNLGFALTNEQVEGPHRELLPRVARYDVGWFYLNLYMNVKTGATTSQSVSKGVSFRIPTGLRDSVKHLM